MVVRIDVSSLNREAQESVREPNAEPIGRVIEMPPREELLIQLNEARVEWEARKVAVRMDSVKRMAVAGSE